MNRLKDIESIISEKGLKPIPYQIDFLNKYREFDIPTVLGAGTSSGKTFTTAIWIEMFYKDPKNKGKRTLLIPASTTVLRDNMGDSFGFFNPKFTYIVCENGEQLKEAIKGTCDVIICLPQTIVPSISHLTHFHNFILDEAHQWYFKDTISQIIKKIKPKNQLLLTGTPSKFIAKGDKFNLFFVPIMELYRLGLVSNVKIEVVSSTYNPSQEDYNGLYSSLGNKYDFETDDNSKSLKMVCNQMIKKLKNPSSMKDKHLINRWLNNPLSILGDIDKTIIFCHSQNQANQFYKILNKTDELKGNVLISHTDIDKDSLMFSEFKTNDTKKILIAVDRGKLGFSMGELFNIVDFTVTQNLDMLLQMYGRLLRLSEHTPSKEKIYYKVATKNTAGYFVDLMTAMLCLTDMEYYSKYNGKNMGGIRIPKVLMQTKTKGIARAKSKSKKVTPYISMEQLGIPLDLCFFKNVSLYKQTDKFSTVAECTLEDVRTEFFDITRWNFDSVVEIAKTCYGRNELSIKSSGAYSWARKNNRLDDLDQYYLIKEPKWTLEKAIKSAKKYKTIGEVQQKNNSLAHWVYNNGFRDTVYAHMDFREDWTEQKIIDVANTFKKKVLFQRQAPQPYKAARRLGILDKVTSHMEQNVRWNVDMVNDVIKKNNIKHQFGLRECNSSAYSAYRRLKMNSLTKGNLKK